MGNGFDLIALLGEPLQYSFMQRGMFAVLLIGAISGVVGCYVVVRGMAFFGDALAHSILPGVAVAYITGGDLFLGGLAAGISAAVGIGWLTREERIKEDTAVGVVFAGMFALGIAIISTAGSYSVDLAHILFGDVLGVGESDLTMIAALGVLALGATLLFYKEFLILSFDAGLAQTLKLPGEALRLLLLALVAVTIVASLQTVGLALMVAMLVTPAATARLLVRRLHHMMIVAGLLGALSGIAGFYFSYYLDIPSGPAIVLTVTVLFLAVFGLVQIRRR
ncbi:MAG: metal ABC transporter permease [Anaerolineae bacterium]|nr:metal ABC transporter permease [Anaerolineae bacterium]